jgi:hypothetical protein
MGGDDGGDDDGGSEVASADDLTDEDDASDDLSDESDDFSDESDDFSDDLTSDVTDDFADDFSDDFTDDSSGDTTGQVDANNLRVGDCVEDEASVTSAMVSTIDCGSPHVFEVFGRFDISGGSTFPGDTVVNTEGQRCLEALFEDYIGVPYAQSAIYATPLVPTAQTWGVGDRTVLCLAHSADRSPTTGSVEGANR